MKAVPSELGPALAPAAAPLLAILLGALALVLTPRTRRRRERRSSLSLFMPSGRGCKCELWGSQRSQDGP